MFSPWNRRESPEQEPGTDMEVWYEAEWPLAGVVGKERLVINGAGAKWSFPWEETKLDPYLKPYACAGSCGGE